MAAAPLSLSDLIQYQWERLKGDAFVYTDELQLQRHIFDSGDRPTAEQLQRHYGMFKRKSRRPGQGSVRTQHEEDQYHHNQGQQVPEPSEEALPAATASNRRPSAALVMSPDRARSEYQIDGIASGTAAGALRQSTPNLRCRRSASATWSGPDFQRDLNDLVAGFGAAQPFSAAFDMSPTTSTAASNIAADADASYSNANNNNGTGSLFGRTGRANSTANIRRTATVTSISESEEGIAGAAVGEAGAGQHLGFKAQVLEWFHQLHDRGECFKSEEDSNRLRDAGNSSYRKERHALKASDLYTEALFVAPPVDSIAAAMAHANRSTVLHDFGMYEQSYDDCLCALELGYPSDYHAMIKLRQATCALKMRKFGLCEEHLHELLHMELTDLFQERTHEIWHECELLKSQKFEMGIQTDEEDIRNSNARAYEISWHDSSKTMTTHKGSYLRATADVAAHKVLFREEAALFVPSGQARICDNCGITQFVPFPCLRCANRFAVYCSRKCRSQHEAAHALECLAHQIELFDEFDAEFSQGRLVQLALRMLTTGLPQVVPHCRKRPTVNKLWAAFNGVLTERTDIAYSRLLRLEANRGGVIGATGDDLEEVVAYAVLARIVAIYLNECTDFFEQLQQRMPASMQLGSAEDWEVLASALLLRHIFQLRHKNLIHCPSFVLPADPHILSPANEFRIWQGVRRVYPGHLHLLTGDVTSVAYAIFPLTLAACRHSCDPNVLCQFSGRKMTAYTTADIKAGDKVTHCFSSRNCRQSLYESRKEELQEKGLGECKCEKCRRPCPDEDFHKFHRYRCDNPNCKQIFTPTQLKDTNNLQWWDSPYYNRPENNGSELLVCTICEQTQKLEWYWTFSAALDDCATIEERCKLYAALDRADMHLIEMHECKVAMARLMVQRLLLYHRDGPTELDEWEFNKLGSLVRSSLHFVFAQYHYSIEYVQHMSYFWDIMALSNYKCTHKELAQMLGALEFLPDDFKEIFNNYNESFIAPKFQENTQSQSLDTEV